MVFHAGRHDEATGQRAALEPSSPCCHRGIPPRPPKRSPRRRGRGPRSSLTHRLAGSGSSTGGTARPGAYQVRSHQQNQIRVLSRQGPPASVHSGAGRTEEKRLEASVRPVLEAAATTGTTPGSHAHGCRGERGCPRDPLGPTLCSYCTLGGGFFAEQAS